MPDLVGNPKDKFSRDKFHIYEPHGEKTCLWGFRPGLTQTSLFSYRRLLEAWNFGFRKERDCTIRVVKTKALISFVDIVKLICVFVFAYAKSWFSHDAAHIYLVLPTPVNKFISPTEMCYLSKRNTNL